MSPDVGLAKDARGPSDSSRRQGFRVVAVIQARSTSRRFPGKVLRPLLGRPMLACLLEAVRHCTSIDGIVLATSTDETDDAVAACGERSGVVCHRGTLDDVARRVLGAAAVGGADALVRLSGDSPLLDPALVDEAVKLFRSTSADLVSNVCPRTFPRGQSVEVLSCESLARAVEGMTTTHECEHVTPYFYSHPAEFAIRSFSATRPRPEVQLSVDTEEDLARCEAILERLGGPAWEVGWEACVRAADTLDARVDGE